MNMLIRAMIEPALRRAGSILGTYVTTLELNAADVSILQSAIPVVLGLVFDLAHSHLAAKLGWK